MARLSAADAREEDSRKDIYSLKQKIVETESARETIRKDAANLQRRYNELEEELRLREKDYQMALDDARNTERKLSDKLRVTETSLEYANGEMGELKLKLSAAEGIINALEAQLAQVEGQRQK